MPTPTTVQARFQVRADTAANWTSANPTLLLNEIGIETDTKKLKMGDGTTAWASLAYFPSIVSGGTVLGNLEIGTTGTLTFEGSTADGFETTLAVVDPTADRTITLPNATGTVILNSGGQTIQFGAGAVGTPSITTVGDLDTGIWFPAANTTAISTGGSERLRIDSSGRVGIGTSSPAAAFQVSGSATVTSQVNVAAKIGSNVTSDLLIGSINGNTPFIASEGAYPLQLRTNATVALTIDSSQRVGIGTTSPGGTLDIKAAASTAPLIVQGSSSEFARIDSSGRMLVGTSSNFNSYLLQVEGTSTTNGWISSRRNSADATAAILLLAKSRGTTVGSNTVVQNGDSLGSIVCRGNDGTADIVAASIAGIVDAGVSVTAGSFVVGRRYKIATLGTTDFTLIGASANTVGVFFEATGVGTGTGTATTEPYTNSMPGRWVFSTTADGASSPTERLRITNDGVRGYNQAAPVAVDVTATLTVANLKNGIITSTTAAAVTGTLPTGTLTEGGFSGLYTNFTFEWTVINTGATNNFTVAAGTDHTVVGNMVVAAGNSGRFATRRTAANTFVTYRLSS